MASTTGKDAIEGMEELRDANEPTPAPEREKTSEQEKADQHAKAEGFASETAYEDYLHAVAEDAPIEEIVVDIERAAAREELERQIEDVRAEINHLRARLHIIRHQAGSVVEENIRWADASAHAQLGAYPWLKLSGAMAAAFLVGKALQRLPFGSLVTAAAPLLIAAARERGR
ncbi:MAG: hypothetical protein AAAB19_00575 [Rhizobium sp.]|jgi:uncharacterized protein YdbL (DUF1318 family)